MFWKLKEPAVMIKMFRSFPTNSSGGVLIYTALALPVLLGATGLSTDVALWYAHKRVIQSAADSAAVAGALEVLRTENGTLIVEAAGRDAVSNGYKAAAGDIMSVNYPPSSGTRAGAEDSVEVVIRRPAPTLFSRIFLEGPVTISARAVATAAVMDTCVWALDPTAGGAVKVSGGAQVSLGCGMIVNSNDPNALTQSGSGSCLTASRVKVVGNFAGTCIQPNPMTGVSAIQDPLKSLAPPSHGSCDHHGKTRVGAGESVTLQPGVYCGAIEVVSDGSLSFAPGVYVLDGAGLKFSAQANVVGEGVSFYLSGNSGAADNISIQAGAKVSLSATTSGDLAGVLFYHDRNSPTNVTHSLTGGSTMDLEGILYFPKQNLNFSGGTSLDSSASMIIANTVSFTGQSHLGNLEDSAVQTNPSLITAALVE